MTGSRSPAAPGSPDHTGSVALATVVASLAFALLALLVVAGAASMHVAAARARTAADAAALAGAGTSPLVGGGGEDPCRAAAVLAGANGARLRRCRTGAVHGEVGGEVAVTVGVAPPLRLPGLPAQVEARAAAGIRPTGRAP